MRNNIIVEHKTTKQQYAVLDMIHEGANTTYILGRSLEPMIPVKLNIFIKEYIFVECATIPISVHQDEEETDNEEPEEEN